MSRKQYAIDESYEGITPFFGLFSRLFESKARAKSLELAALQDGCAMLIVAPPTEFFVERLLTLNPSGDNHLLYFSDGMKQRAVGRLGSCYSHTTTVGRPNELPYEDDTFHTVFAYCYFDFLSCDERDPAAAEMWRVLRPGGRLLTTYLTHPRGILQRIGVATTLGLQLLSKGVQDIDLKPVLERSGFSRIQIVPCPQKGLPIELAGAEKSVTPL
jgi:ubiquinone/menaquinone biosynthesis C-methylase UbiE